MKFIQKKQLTQDLVCSHFRVTFNDVKGVRRCSHILKARHTYMWLMCMVLKESNSQCGRDLNRHHTVVGSAIKKIKGYYEYQDRYIAEIEYLKQLLKQKTKK